MENPKHSKRLKQLEGARVEDECRVLVGKLIGCDRVSPSLP